MSSEMRWHNGHTPVARTKSPVENHERDAGAKLPSWGGGMGWDGIVSRSMELVE